MRMVVPIPIPITPGMENTVFSFGGGGLCGFLAGYALKRIVQIAAIIVGAFILGIAFLSYKGWITTNWQVIEEQTRHLAYNASAQVLAVVNDTASKFATAAVHPSLAHTEAIPISAAIGFMAGFFLGVRR